MPHSRGSRSGRAARRQRGGPQSESWVAAQQALSAAQAARGPTARRRWETSTRSPPPRCERGGHRRPAISPRSARRRDGRRDIDRRQTERTARLRRGSASSRARLPWQRASRRRPSIDGHRVQHRRHVGEIEVRPAGHPQALHQSPARLVRRDGKRTTMRRNVEIGQGQVEARDRGLLGIAHAPTHPRAGASRFRSRRGSERLSLVDALQPAKAEQRAVRLPLDDPEGVAVVAL